MTCKRTHSDSDIPKACDTLVTSALTSNGNLVLQSSVAFPMRAGNPVERENMLSWESLAVASLWMHCSGVVAADLRALADELGGHPMPWQDVGSSTTPATAGAPMESEIERLRASVIVDAAVLQAIIEGLPPSQRSAVCADIVGKLEQFTVRTLNSTMPESFSAAQQERAAAWKAFVAKLSAA